MFAKIIKKLLIDCDLSQAELASRVGLSKGNLSMQLSRDNFREQDMRILLEAIGYDLVLEVKKKDDS